MPELPRADLTTLHLHHYAKQPQLLLRFSRCLALALVLFAGGFAFVPWQQAVRGGGRVVALSPTERRQNLDAPVSGRIVRWHVVEGSRVKAGDPIAEMTDMDPQYMLRIEEQIRADDARIAAAETRLRVYSEQAESYETARRMEVQAMRLKVDMATQKVRVAEQKASVAKANLETVRLNQARLEELTDRGIASQRQREVALLELAKAEASLKLSEAEVLEAKANRLAAQSAVAGADAKGGAKVATSRAEVGKAESEAAYARRDISKLKVDRARQMAQTITSPVDGTVVSIIGTLGGGVVKSGQHLASIVPDTESRAVEVYVDGNDAPLLAAAGKVRLQLEGWPALQFVGPPGGALGTFGGEVRFVDPAATDRHGRVRVLIVPDEDSSPWPEASVLRQQVRAQAWFLLDTVPLGRELWRRINGFPLSLGGSRPMKQSQVSTKDKS